MAYNLENAEINLESIEEFYRVINKLEQIKRTGWVIRNVPAERLESVADHTLQVIILAITLNHELNLGFNIARIAQMGFIHDIGEALIGDIPAVDPDYRKKKELESEAVKKALSTLSEDTAELYYMYWLEFESKATKDAEFLYQVDKMDALLKAKEYAKSHNMPGLFEEFYNWEKEKGTFDDGPLKEMFDILTPSVER